MKLKITPIGNSFGVILPREALAKLKVAGGDSVFITETQDGFRITPYFYCVTTIPGRVVLVALLGSMGSA